MATAPARAADLPVAPPPIAPTVGAFNIFEGMEAHVQVEAGDLFNADSPTQGADGKGYNFGHLYTDHANVPELNQALFTIEKLIDPKATGYAFGFTAQAMYGSDMRFNHYLGIGTFFMGDQRAQFNVIQGFGAVHAPIGSTASTDLKIGLFSSPQGYETLDPSTTPFYSHSYTYNYAVTFNHTGILSTTHINPTLDLWLGIDTGNQTTFGQPIGDPNGEPAGFVGFGLNNLLNNKLTVLALSHIGPEQNSVADPFGYKSDLRFYDDVVLTYKINDDWTAVFEGNYTRDAYGYGPALGGAAEYYSGVGYLSYAFNKDFTFNVRGEIARDTKNFFVSTPEDNSGIAKSEIDGGTGTFVAPLTAPTLAGIAGQGTTYGAATLGLTYKPEVPKPFALAMVRPEIRYDRILDGSNLFNSSTSGVLNGQRNQFTFGGDIVIGF